MAQSYSVFGQLATCCQTPALVQGLALGRVWVGECSNLAGVKVFLCGLMSCARAGCHLKEARIVAQWRAERRVWWWLW